MHTAEHVTGEGGMEDLEMAVNALEEIQRWHTSVVNPNVKNEFANRSTQICHNCDHKDEYIEELEAEVEAFRTIGTVEECRTAVEKQTAKKITHPGCRGKDGVWHTWNGINGVPYCLCPHCETNLCTDGLFAKDKGRLKFCENCGQKLDWKDEE